MYIPITTAALALLTAAMILLRIFWSRVPPRLRFFLIRASTTMIILHGLFVVTKWNTTSGRLNVFINWMALAGYELLVVLFSRLPPRWLTLPSTIILLIPLFAASILGPLTYIFDPASRETLPLGDHLFYEIDPWTNAGGGNQGVDVVVYYRPPFPPFIRHKLQSIQRSGVQLTRSLCHRFSGKENGRRSLPKLALSGRRSCRQGSPPSLNTIHQFQEVVPSM
jgi:hypothetical protein